MKLKIRTKEELFRFCLFALLQLFTLVSMLVAAFGKKDFQSAFVCFTTVLFLCVPDLAAKLFRFKIPLPVYIFVLIYAISHMLGHTYEFYYNVPYYDKILHTTGGVVFALFGAYLPKALLKKNDCNIVLCALFGLLFSIFIGVMWEFVEYSFDTLFDTDMQKDTLISVIHSYKLGEALGLPTGTIGSIPSMEELVIMNGDTVLYEGQYLDIGLVDTMMDMLVEAAGAFLFTAVYLLDKGVHTSFQFVAKEEPCETAEQLAEAAVSQAEE